MGEMMGPTVRVWDFRVAIRKQKEMKCNQKLWYLCAPPTQTLHVLGLWLPCVQEAEVKQSTFFP